MLSVPVGRLCRKLHPRTPGTGIELLRLDVCNVLFFRHQTDGGLHHLVRLLTASVDRRSATFYQRYSNHIRMRHDLTRPIVRSLYSLRSKFEDRMDPRIPDQPRLESRRHIEFGRDH
jgi:hypothetical protein